MKKTFIVSLALFVMAPAVAQKRAFTIEDIYRLQYATSPAVAKDGRLAYTVSKSDLKNQRSQSNVIVDGKPVSTDGKSFAPAWSQSPIWAEPMAKQTKNELTKWPTTPCRHISPTACYTVIGPLIPTANSGISSSTIR